MGHLRHYPGPDDLDCLLKDAAHGVCSLLRRVDTLAVVCSPRMNIRPLSVLLLRMPPYAPTTRLLAPVAEAFLPSHVLLFEFSRMSRDKCPRWTTETRLLRIRTMRSMLLYSSFYATGV
jgi:hypothetical protein